ncbi:MAG: hypothetical protein AAGJ46_04600 [Planctomycetota bacterium]
MTFAGRDAAIDPYELAGGWLRESRRTLICGLGAVSVEAQRLAVELADRLRGAVDWTGSPADAASVLAFQAVGGVGATYGEIADRSNLIVYWRCEPKPLPGFDRIGDGATRSIVEVPSADFPLADGADYEALGVLRALAAGVALDETVVEQQTGVSLNAWRALLDRIAGANYATIVRGKPVAEGGPAAVAAMTQLAQEVHDRTRVVVASLPSESNATGAENVLAWQTGYPMAVDFARGYPRYLPGEATFWSAGERGEWDVIIRLDTGPIIDVQPKHVSHPPHAVGFPITPLSEGGGTWHRNDGVALPLPTRGGAATAESVLRGLIEAVGDEDGSASNGKTGAGAHG